MPNGQKVKVAVLRETGDPAARGDHHAPSAEGPTVRAAQRHDPVAVGWGERVENKLGSDRSAKGRGVLPARRDALGGLC